MFLQTTEVVAHFLVENLGVPSTFYQKVILTFLAKFCQPPLDHVDTPFSVVYKNKIIVLRNISSLVNMNCIEPWPGDIICYIITLFIAQNKQTHQKFLNK